jgi:protein-S-isoprenylcysteine O-methyltransferase Ste14
MNARDPLGWFARIVPMQLLHRIIRGFMIAVLLVFLFLRIRHYHTFFWKPLWLAETLLFVVLIIAFTIRQDPVDRSRGIKEIVVPLIGSALPFVLLRTEPSFRIAGNRGVLTAIFVWMTFATGLTTWGMWTLRRSFSITVEARELVIIGPYRWVRHPVYLGEMLSAAAVLVWRWSLLNLAVFALFTAIQLLRSRWEETKLLNSFPAYRKFAARSRWFWR